MEKISPDFQVPVSGLENSSRNLESISPAITIPNNVFLQKATKINFVSKRLHLFPP